MPPRDRQHPNEKPLGLMRHFIDLHSVPGQVVMDPFMGSGSTGVAAVEMGRKFIGVELDPVHFETAIRRVEAAMRQGDMLVAPIAAPPEQTELLGPDEAFERAVKNGLFNGLVSKAGAA